MVMFRGWRENDVIQNVEQVSILKKIQSIKIRQFMFKIFRIQQFFVCFNVFSINFLSSQFFVNFQKIPRNFNQRQF